MDTTLSVKSLWEDAVGFLLGNREVALAIGLTFFFLPTLIGGMFLPEPAMNQVDWGAMLPVMILVALIQTFGQLSLLALYLDPARPTVGEAMRTAIGLYPSAVLLALLIGLIVGAGFLLLILPGVYLAARLFPAIALLVAERRSIGDTVSRAWAITRGAAWQILLFLVLWVLALIFCQVLAQITIGSIGLLIGKLIGAEALGRIIGEVAVALVGMVFSLIIVTASGAACRRLGGI